MFFFGGYIPYIGDEEIDYINLTSAIKINNQRCPDIGEDSSWDKYFYALKWLYYSTSAKYYMIVGTTTFIDIPNLLSYLEKCNPADHLYMGSIKLSIGENFIRRLDDKDILFMSAGPGIIYSHPTIIEIIKLFDEIINEWKYVCNRSNQDYLYPAYDVAIAYYMNKLGIVPTINDKMYLCNEGYTDNLISCYSMMRTEMVEFNEFLRTKKDI